MWTCYEQISYMMWTCYGRKSLLALSQSTDYDWVIEINTSITNYTDMAID